MFNLTSVASRTQRSGSKSSLKPVSPSSVRSSSELKGPFSSQILKLRAQVKEYSEKTESLRTTIERLNGAMERMSYRKALYKEFDQDLSEIFERLGGRFVELSAAEGSVKAFRQTPEQSAVNHAKPVNERKTLMSENKRLVELALSQERQMLLMKMRLRLCHDHRDLAQLRRVLNKLEGGGEDYREDEEITRDLKKCIGNLKRAIEREKERIRVSSLPDTTEHDAAIVIQKTFRGWLYRQLHKPVCLTTPAVPVVTEDHSAEVKEAHEDAPAAAAEPE